MISAIFEPTAILIFSRTARHEAAVKTFDAASGKNGNQAIARKLIRQTVATARRTRLPVFLHSTPAHVAGTFGENLAAALESVFDKGYVNVIAIGNDCPDISVALLLDASRRLAAKKLVLGPATDGGVYLIGIHKTAAYHRRKFVALPWEGARLQAGWEKYSKDFHTDVDWLQPFSDIDQAADFKALLDRLPCWSHFRKQLLSILASFQSVFTAGHRLFPVINPHGISPLRGPPPY